MPLPYSRDRAMRRAATALTLVAGLLAAGCGNGSSPCNGLPHPLRSPGPLGLPSSLNSATRREVCAMLGEPSSVSRLAGKREVWTYPPPAKPVLFEGDHVVAPPAPPPPETLAPGTRKVAHVRLPDGRRGAISVRRIRYQGRIFLCLLLGTGRDAVSQCSPWPLSPDTAYVTSSAGCDPDPATLVYGIVLAPKATVTLETPSDLLRARRRTVPPALRAGGDVFFVTAHETPATILVGLRGRTLQSTPVAGPPPRCPPASAGP